MAGDPAARKRALRGAARSPDPTPSGAQSGGDLRARGVAAQELLLAELDLSAAPTVALYAAIEHEVPLEQVARALADAGARVVFPRVRPRDQGRELALHESDPSSLVPGYRGILEPDTRAPSVDPEEVDVFVIPGLLFDVSGNRLGRGAGHYDALLARVRRDALRLGLCYAERVVNEIPSEAHDQRVHLVVTDRDVIRSGLERR